MTSRASSIVTGILLGSSATLIVSWVYNKLSKKKNAARTDDTKPHQQREQKQHQILPLSLREEQLSRSSLYFGDENMSRLSQNTRVCIVGVGGVGSHAAVSLARAGLGPLIRLVDFDQVTLSSLNRHACATLQDVGTPKVTCVQEYIRKIIPNDEYLTVDARVELFNAESAHHLLALPNQHTWDMVIDAIDDIPTKAELIQYCLQHQIPVVSCMSAGGKADVTRLHISDLQSAAKDPLATKLRQTLKRIISKTNSNDEETGISSSYLEDMEQLSIVYSSEKTVVKLAELTADQKAAPHTFGAMDYMRVRVVPVLGTMPAIMGLSLAAVTLTRLGNKPLQPVPCERVGRSVRHKMLQHLKIREERIQKKILEQVGLSPQTNATNDIIEDDEKELLESELDATNDTDNQGRMVDGIWIGRVQVDMDDVEYLMEVWRNRCAVTGARLGAVLALARWNMDQPSTTNNLVLMSSPALKRFDQPNGKSQIPVAVQRMIEERLAACRNE
jgi:tRNA A37 threonylcarbamoyladenosine dehydratase